MIRFCISTYFWSEQARETTQHKLASTVHLLKTGRKKYIHGTADWETLKII